MTNETAGAESRGAMACPRDGVAMAPVGRRGRAYRCPTCKGMFLDVETMRRGRAAQRPMWAPFLMSALMSVAMTLLVRWLKRRPKS